MENANSRQKASTTAVVYRNRNSKAARFRRKRSSLILEPLYAQVTNFVRDAARKKSRKGKRSKKSEILMTEIANALLKLVRVGRGIAFDYPEVRDEMSSACRNIEILGTKLKIAAVDFFNFPCSPSKRQDMVRAADALLSGVTRMLYIADIADALRLQASLKQVDKKLADLDLSRNTRDLIKSFKRLGKDLLTVTSLTSDIEDVNDPEQSKNLEAACDTLRRTGVTLESATKKYGSEQPVLRDIRNDFYGVLQQVIGATDVISNVLHPDSEEDGNVKSVIDDIITHFMKAGSASSDNKPPEVEVFKFSEALSNIDEKIDVCSCVYSDMTIRTEVQRSLNKIIKEAAVVADLSGVKEKTRSALLQSCFKTTDTVRNAIAKYTDGDSDILDEDEFQRQTIVGIAREASKDLRKSVLNSLLDHISSKYKGMEKFLSPGAILNTDEAHSLHEYVEYMKEIARLTTFLSEDDKMKNNIDGAVKRLSYIRKEVIATSEVLANSKKKLNTCKASWKSNVTTLEKAMRSISNDGSTLQTSLLRVPGKSDYVKASNDFCSYGVSGPDDSYWWDSTTDSFAPRSPSSSSADFPLSGSDHNPISDESSEYSENFGATFERITERYESKIRTLTPQPQKTCNGSRNTEMFTPQPIRRACSQMAEPYSPHPRRRYRSFSSSKKYLGHDFEDLQMAVSDMQVNIAPKLASFLSRTTKGNHSKCNDENHTVIVDSLKLVYKGIQTICSALLDENQFKQPKFTVDGRKVAVENGTEERPESRDSKSPDDDYFDKDVMNLGRLSGLEGYKGDLWGTNGRLAKSTPTCKKGKETTL